MICCRSARQLCQWGLLLALVLVISGCVAPAPPADSAAAPAVDESKMTIKLAENPWSASAINVNVAKILLEEQLGYPVEIVDVDENAQWAALSTGDLHASLEVWPSGHADNVAEYIDKQGVVENGGALGVIGRIGWYIPSYLLTDHPELAAWEGFAGPEAAAMFATAETGSKGQYLTGDPSWVSYEEQIIDNLGMDFQIVAAGSEEAILSSLSAAESRQDPLLFYFWTPHSIHAKYDLTRVELPAYSDECYAKADANGVDCDYPEDVLFKIFWGGLADAAPDAHALLTNMSYATEDQIQMIAAVELDGSTPADAARAWLDAHEDVWRSWLPQ
ncbi:MAG: ABC transporter substrate-binding protein [Caldilineaceae bacterium]